MLRHQLRDRRGVRTRGASIVGAVDVAANNGGGFGSPEVLGDSEDDLDDESAWPRSRSRVISSGLRDELRDPRCVATWTWAATGTCIRAAVRWELCVVRVFTLLRCSCAVVDEGGPSPSISEFEKQSQSGVPTLHLARCVGHDMTRLPARHVHISVSGARLAASGAAANDDDDDGF